jgi:hypothetical protein
MIVRTSIKVVLDISQATTRLFTQQHGKVKGGRVVGMSSTELILGERPFARNELPLPEAELAVGFVKHFIRARLETRCQIEC